jgi:hypothetical protein
VPLPNRSEAAVFPIDADFANPSMNFRSRMLLDNLGLIELSEMVPQAPLLEPREQALLSGRETPSWNTLYDFELYVEQFFDTLSSRLNMIEPAGTATRGSEGPQRVGLPQVETTMRDPESNTAKSVNDPLEQIIAQRLREISQLRAVVDANWKSERPPSRGNLQLATRYILSPEELTVDESAEVLKMMDADPKLKKQIEALSAESEILRARFSRSD